MRYIVFSFGEGDYLCNEDGSLLIFDSKGLAFQYMQKHYHNPVPVSKTKKIINYPAYYSAPFKLQKVC